MNILKPKTAKNNKMQVLGFQFSKMTAPNFRSNSLFGANTVFKESCQTKGGPHKTPQEGTNCRANNLLKLQTAIWNPKKWSFGSSNWSFGNKNLPFGNPKSNILKPKICKNDKMQALGPKVSKMIAPNFWSNSVCGASTVFKENCQIKGGDPTRHPKKLQIVEQTTF